MKQPQPLSVFYFGLCVGLLFSFLSFFYFFFSFLKLLIFPFKEKQEKRHSVDAFCELLIHKARSFTGSQPRILGLAENLEVLVLIDLKREEKILESKTKGGPGLSGFGIFLTSRS